MASLSAPQPGDRPPNHQYSLLPHCRCSRHPGPEGWQHSGPLLDSTSHCSWSHTTNYSEIGVSTRVEITFPPKRQEITGKVEHTNIQQKLHCSVDVIQGFLLLDICCSLIYLNGLPHAGAGLAEGHLFFRLSLGKWCPLLDQLPGSLCVFLGKHRVRVFPTSLQLTQFQTV